MSTSNESLHTRFCRVKAFIHSVLLISSPKDSVCFVWENSLASCTLWCYHQSLNNKVVQFPFCTGTCTENKTQWNVEFFWYVSSSCHLFPLHETALFSFVAMWNTEMSYLVHSHSAPPWHGTAQSSWAPSAANTLPICLVLMQLESWQIRTCKGTVRGKFLPACFNSNLSVFFPCFLTINNFPRKKKKQKTKNRARYQFPLSSYSAIVFSSLFIFCIIFSYTSNILLCKTWAPKDCSGQ